MSRREEACGGLPVSATWLPQSPDGGELQPVVARASGSWVPGGGGRAPFAGALWLSQSLWSGDSHLQTSETEALGFQARLLCQILLDDSYFFCTFLHFLFHQQTIGRGVCSPVWHQSPSSAWLELLRCSAVPKLVLHSLGTNSHHILRTYSVTGARQLC